MPPLIGVELAPGEYRLGATEEEWRQVLEIVNDSVEYPKGSGQRIDRFEKADLSQTLIMNMQGKTIAIFVEKGVRIDPVVYVDQFEALLNRFLYPGFFDDDKINTYLLMFSTVTGVETYNLGGQGIAFPKAVRLDRQEIPGVKVAISTESSSSPGVYSAGTTLVPPDLIPYRSTYSYLLEGIQMLEMSHRECSSHSACSGVYRDMHERITVAPYDLLKREGELHPDGTKSYPVWLIPYK